MAVCVPLFVSVCRYTALDALNTATTAATVGLAQGAHGAMFRTSVSYS